MAARRRTSRKTPTRRRSAKPMVNVLKTAESLVLANAATQGLFGMNAVAFATEGWLRPMTSASNNSWELSAAEIVKGITGGSFGFGEQFISNSGGNPLMAAIKKNIQDNGAQAVGTMILAPIAFKAARRVLARPLINPTNRLLKSSGLSTIVKL